MNIKAECGSTVDLSGLSNADAHAEFAYLFPWVPFNIVIRMALQPGAP